MFFKTRKEMQSLINASRKSLKNAEEKIEQRNNLLRSQTEEIKALKSRIKDLENNIEILVHNSKNRKIKELVIDGKSKN